ncbi:cytochrome c oxidase subunit II [Faunimonas pinastri]|nr:cytochrome c oxidase subunit II [Faunimonas pinastri]
MAKWTTGSILFAAGSVLPRLAHAADVKTGPYAWETHFQPAATKVMADITWFGWYTLSIMTAVVLFVTLLIAYVVWRFRERANPVPSRVSHNTLIEVLWTIIPVLILLAIAIPSFRLLYAEYDPTKLYADYNPQTTKFLTVKATGSQWYWSYSYATDQDSKDNGVVDAVNFDSLLVPDSELKTDQLRNLSVDNAMVVPVGTFVRLQVTGADVIHSFAMPPFGVKVDAVPGRLNETYFRAEREGVFYGQCSELCGKDHAFMPIVVQVVSQDQFRHWAGQAATDLPGANKTLAEAVHGGSNEKVAVR